MNNNKNKYEAIKGEELILKYKLREPLVDIDNPGLLILLHGVGSNENGLFDMAELLPADMIIVSVRAPYTLRPNSYAWFDVQFSSGTSIINPEQAEKSRTVLNMFVNQLTERFQVNMQQIYIGGFSQGGIMAYSVGLTFPQKFAGIFSLSGRLLKEVRPLIKASDEINKLRVFIAHGTDDKVLSVNYALEARAYLQALGVNAEYHEYPIAHSIEQQELDDLNKWLLK
ncbi:MAG: alpha/beta hydrolase-fold protein [Mucilaginibacter sp.]|uniref:alpha/beta hydrolase n=1 Tax=Mucilaginibacter sp. TaxID=1882438 RepID=UPI0031B33640